MKAVDSETKFLAREIGELSFTIEQEESFIRSISDSKDTMMLVGTVEDQIVANCSVGLVNGNKRFLHRASIGIAIQKKYWRRGIGKIMMLKCISWCKHRGVEQLELEVVTTNKSAVALYQSLGFVIYGIKKNAMKYSDGSYADEYFMILEL
jgi:ribosomal protein S18 acetylase RimI-like enzyme